MKHIKAAILDRELKKGSAELLILSLVEHRARHGYELGKLIEERSEGRIKFKVASLYPLLYRLEQRGWIQGRWVEKAGQRRRRFYRLTAGGRTVLGTQRTTWAGFVSAIRFATKRRVACYGSRSWTVWMNGGGVRMRRLAIALALVSLLVVSLLPDIGTAQRAGGAPTLSKVQWREDLQYLARELPKRHKNLFHTVSREQFARAVAELDTAIPSLEDHQIIVRMLQITAMIGDAHTYVHLPQTFKLYPVSLYWFGSDLRVIRAAPENKQALGAKVVKVGGMSISDVQTRLLKVLSQSENEWFVLNNSPGYMARPEVLQTLGVVPNVSQAEFTFEDEQGKQFPLNLTPVVLDSNLNSLWLKAATSEPLSRQKQNEPFWFSYLPESQTVYVSFKGYDSLSEKARKLFEFVDGNSTKRLVVDMRQNGGGDFTKVRSSLLPAIKQRPAINQKGHLFVIIGRRTFSAAMTNAIDFRKDTNAILVGEPAGERPNSYQENDEMKLPNSGLVVSYSTKYYKFLDEDAPAVMPDKRIDPNWLDFKAGRDPVMDWILLQKN